MKKRILFLIAMFICSFAWSQDDGDLLSLVGDNESINYATASFKTNRVINGHSIENTHAGVMDVKISHRFSVIRNGIYDLFGLDGATIRIGVDYGITNRLMVGIGRHSREKLFDGFAKYKLLRQSSGKKNMPITLSYVVDAQIRTERNSSTEVDTLFSSRLFYTHQLLIGRKFSEGFSLQIMPTILHRNTTASAQDKNDVFSIGIAGRVKISKRVAVTAEYYYVPENQIVSQPYANSLSIGFDIETGGHVFQFHFTNSRDMSYKGFITETDQNWFTNEDDNFMSHIRFGFNISRVFTIVKPKEF